MAYRLHMNHILIGMMIFLSAQAVKFPNEVDGQPEIECGDGTVRISVKTTNGSASRLYAKGHYNDDQCHFERTNNGTFSMGSCGMNRQRQLDPRGVSYGLVVVVQFHPMFVTKVDKAYSIKCFYMETEKAVTSLLGVSMLTTQTITGGPAMPICNYELHGESPNGPNVRYARVGDMVWHTWHCPSSTYGILVHTCVVTDGQGNDFRVIDERGCSLDQYVFRTPEYNEDLTRVQQETHVFKFADKTAVVFNCQIKLCQKTDNGCDGISPPNCPSVPSESYSTIVPGSSPSSLTPVGVIVLSNGTVERSGALLSTTDIFPTPFLFTNSTSPPLNVSSSSDTSFDADQMVQNLTFAALRNETDQNETISRVGNSSAGLANPSNWTVLEIHTTDNDTTVQNETRAMNWTMSNSKNGYGNLTWSELREDDVRRILLGDDAVLEESVDNEVEWEESNTTQSPIFRNVSESGSLGEDEDGRGRRQVERTVLKKTMDAVDEVEKGENGELKMRDEPQEMADMETDVSQMMWVLEPEERMAKENRRGASPFDSREGSLSDEDGEWGRWPSTRVCISKKTVLALLMPLLVLGLFTGILAVLLVRRRHADSKQTQGRQAFHMDYLYKRA